MGQHNPTWQTTTELPVGYLNEADRTITRQVTLRKMTGREEALLADPKLRGNSGKLISALLANCVVSIAGINQVNPNIIRSLASGDRNFLLLELRRLTFGDELPARYRCPSCQGITEVWENLSELETKQAEDAAQEIQVVLKDGYQDPDGNWQYDVCLRLPNGEDEEVAAGRRDTNPTRQRDALLARCLTRVGDLEERRIRALGVRILADLSMPDRRLIQKALDDAAPGPDLTREITCQHCGEVYQAGLDMSNFFPLE